MARRWSTDQVSGALIVLFGSWFLAQALALREGPGYAAVGPRVFPVIVAIGFVASGLALLLGGLVHPRGHGQTRSRAEEPGSAELHQGPADWTTLLKVAGLLAIYLTLFQPLGFLLASALFLVACARALGSAAWLRDAAVAVGLSLTAYLLFTRLLGLELPAGPLEPLARVLAGTSGTP